MSIIPFYFGFYQDIEMVIWLQLQILTRHFTAILRQHVFFKIHQGIKLSRSSAFSPLL
jgi:hypothetical protein